MSVNNRLNDTIEQNGRIGSIRSSIENHLFTSYLVMTFMICWGVLIPVVILVNHYGNNEEAMVNEVPIIFLLLLKIGSYVFLFAPAISAVILTGIEKGKVGLRDYFKRVFRWRVGIKWIMVVFLFAFGIIFANNIVHVLLGGDFPQPFRAYSLVAIASLFLDYFLIHGGQEELGWRGYAQPLLQTKYDAMKATIITGFFWGLWHLPVFFLMGDPHYGDNFLLFLFATIGVSFLFTIIYNNTKSILIAMLFHALLNTLGVIMSPATELLTIPPFRDTGRIIGVIVFLVFIFVSIFRPERVSAFLYPDRYADDGESIGRTSENH